MPTIRDANRHTHPDRADKKSDAAQNTDELRDRDNLVSQIENELISKPEVLERILDNPKVRVILRESSCLWGRSAKTGEGSGWGIPFLYLY